MREGADRALVIAFAASILLHVVMFRVLPIWRELGALVPPAPEPLIARVVHPAPPAPQPAAAVARPVSPTKRAPAAKPAPEAAPAPKPEPEPDAATTPQASEAFVAQAAPEPAPAPQARIAPPVVAAAPTPPALDPRALAGYSSGLHDAAERFKRYPRVAIDNNWTGEVRLRMAIGEDGRIVSLAVTRGSGHEVLDRQALEMFRNAWPRVSIPGALRGRAFDVELRAVFNLRDQPSG